MASLHDAKVRCATGCSICCHGPIPVSNEDLAPLLVRRLAAKREFIIAREGDMMFMLGEGETAPCPFLDDSRCVVYDERPMICRLYGASRLAKCKHGGETVVSVADDVAEEIMERLFCGRSTVDR